MASRKYTNEDFGTCRWILENYSVGVTAPIVTAGPLTPARAARIRLLNLGDGAVVGAVNGDQQRLAGLGIKTAREAQRLGIAAVT